MHEIILLILKELLKIPDHKLVFAYILILSNFFLVLI
jgi:hypothetical protein